MNMKRFFSTILSIIFFAIALLGVLFAIVGASTGDNSMVIAGSIVAVIFLAFHFIKSAKAKKKKLSEMGESAYRAERASKKEAKKEKKRIAREKVRANATIDYVVITGSESKTSTGSAITRGAVGGALLGPVGMLAAAGAKKNSFVELVVRYKSGRTETVKVKFDSKEFKNYAKYIR